MGTPANPVSVLAAAVPTTTPADWPPDTFPARSVEVTVSSTRSPMSGFGVTVNVQVPLAAAVAVPSVVAPLESTTVLPASAVPESV